VPRRLAVDAPRAVLVALALLRCRRCTAKSAATGLQAFVVVRSALLDGDLEPGTTTGDWEPPVGGERQATSLPAGLALPGSPAAHLGVTAAPALGAAVSRTGSPSCRLRCVGSYLYGVRLLQIETSRDAATVGRRAAVRAQVWLALSTST
jgi:hypothetical protein